MSKKDFKEKECGKTPETADTDGSVLLGFLPIAISVPILAAIVGVLFIAMKSINPYQKEKEIIKAFYQNKTICCNHTPIIKDETKPMIKLVVKDGKLFILDELGKKHYASSCEALEYKEMCELR